MWDKGFGMYDCTQRIPLVISHPSLKGKPAVSKEYVTLMDLAPTFWETAGVRPPQRCDGRSLWPVIDDPARPREKDFIVLQHFEWAFHDLGPHLRQFAELVRAVKCYSRMAAPALQDQVQP